MFRSVGVCFFVAMFFATAAQGQPPWNGGRPGYGPGRVGNPGYGYPRGYPYGRPGGMPGFVPGVVLGMGLIPFLMGPPAAVAPGGYPQPPAQAGSTTQTNTTKKTAPSR
jgi:hypothetical protein